MAPRHGKSELTSHWTPVWYLANWPDRRVILTSYEADFAASWGRKARDSVVENEGLLGIHVRKDVAAIDLWELTDGGGMVTAGTGGPVTGRGGNLIIIDDPVKNWAQAASPTFRDMAWEWYRRTLYSRKEPHASIVCLMQRWHRDDLGGRLIRESGEEWEVIRLPALAEADDPLGRTVGEALWPERYDVEALLGIKTAVGPDAWLAQYQQRPEAASGDCYFNEAVLSEMRDSMPGSPMPEAYNPMRRYTAWIDAAGVGHDRCSLCILSWWGTRPTQIVDYTTDEAPSVFAVKALEFLKDFNNPIVGWERNGVGQAMYEIFHTALYPRIFFENRELGKHGVAQSSNLRQFMLARLQSAVESSEIVPTSKETIDEMLTFVKSASGPPKAAPGAYDDRVMSLAGALWLSMQPGALKTNTDLLSGLVFPNV